MANNIDLTGRSAVVTGGAQGIGRAVVERFLDSGARVAIWDCDAALAQSTAAALAQRGQVAAVVADVTDLATVEAARDTTLAAFGRVDILVNNAGIAGPNVKTWDYPPEAWGQVLAINESWTRSAAGAHSITTSHRWASSSATRSSTSTADI